MRDIISGTELAPEPPPWLAPERSNLQQDPRPPSTRGTCPSPLQPQGPEPRVQGHRPLRGPRDTQLSAGILGRGPPRDTLHPYPPAIPEGPPPSREGSGCPLVSPWLWEVGPGFLSIRLGSSGRWGPESEPQSARGPPHPQTHVNAVLAGLPRRPWGAWRAWESHFLKRRKLIKERRCPGGPDPAFPPPGSRAALGPALLGEPQSLGRSQAPPGSVSPASLGPREQRPPCAPSRGGGAGRPGPERTHRGHSRSRLIPRLWRLRAPTATWAGGVEAAPGTLEWRARGWGRPWAARLHVQRQSPELALTCAPAAARSSPSRSRSSSGASAGGRAMAARSLNCGGVGAGSGRAGGA